MSNIDTWIERIGDRPVPVLSQTIDDVSHYCARENIPIPKLTQIVERDPGLTVQILRTSNQRKKSTLSSEVTSAQQALMMMGTLQLSELPKHLPNINDVPNPRSRQLLLAIFARAYHAGIQAMDWASQRRDMTPDEVFAAAELHFLGEMLFALVAPEKMDEIDTLRHEKHITSGEAQYLVLGFTFNQFTRALARKWNLPTLVIEALHDSNAQYPRAFGVMLGVQVARSAFIDWYSDITGEFYQQAADWLGEEPDAVINRSHRLAADIARESALYEVTPAAAFLPRLKRVISNIEGNDDTIPSSDEYADVCLSPQCHVLAAAMKQLQQAGADDKGLDIISQTVKAMHDGIGLNRVVFSVFNSENRGLQAIVITGSSNDPAFNRFQVKLDSPHLFTHLMDKQQAILINDATRNKFWSLVPGDFAKMIGTNSFIAMSVHVNEKPFGLFYADRHTSSCQIDDNSYKYFKMLSVQCSKILGSLKNINLEQ